jgi:predicted RNase H-like nuclease (RuvC/YqgF family)
MALSKAEIQRRWRNRRNALAKRAEEVGPMLESLQTENQYLKESLRKLERANSRLLSALERATARPAS